jgi:hypothetical protein
LVDLPTPFYLFGNPYCRPNNVGGLKSFSLQGVNIGLIRRIWNQINFFDVFSPHFFGKKACQLLQELPAQLEHMIGGLYYALV